MKKFAVPLIALSLLKGSSLFGDAAYTTEETDWNPNGIPQTSAFNAPSRIEVKGSYDIFLTANFIYWCPSQENMEMGIISDTSNPLFFVDGTVVRQNFDYAPGFQIGIGGNLPLDSWDLFAQYTWFRNTDTVSTSLDIAGSNVLFPFWTKPDLTNPRFFRGKEKWHLSMDLGDVELARSYYIGTSLTFRPFFGIRAAFIRQHLDVDYLNETTGSFIHDNIFVNQTTHSWGLGPRAGLCMNWLLGHGIRMYGNGSADILFTQYTKLDWEQHATTAAGVVLPGFLFRVEEKNLNYLRTHLALELGFGWGDYFGKGDYHFDLSAGYGFQVFFGQNMFRAFSDDLTFNSIAPNGDLFIHGLTVATRFDF